MEPNKTARNYKGEILPAPIGFDVLIAVAGEGSISWTCCDDGTTYHRVIYGLQSTQFSLPHEAADEFAACVKHWCECQGMYEYD